MMFAYLQDFLWKPIKLCQCVIMKIPRVIDTDFPPWRKFCRADKTMFAHPRDCLRKPMKSCHISMKKPHVIYFPVGVGFVERTHPSRLFVIQWNHATYIGLTTNAMDSHPHPSSRLYVIQCHISALGLTIDTVGSWMANNTLLHVE